MEYTILILLLPLLSFLFLGLAGMKLKPVVAGAIGTAVLAVVALLSYCTAFEYFSAGRDASGVFPTLVPWNTVWLPISRTLHIDLGILLDPISVMMLVVISTVSLMVHVYSLGYMKGERGFQRYYAFLSLFTMSMMGLVVATNIFQMYLFWELVGVSSYLLIGFYYTKKEAVAASKKAFIVTRFADLGFLVGILFYGYYAGTFSFTPDVQLLAAAGAMIPLALGLMFIGGAGKSAMFPLHIWLPDAMEGPTPVSALIHAATMVVAGVYLVARMFPLFVGYAPEVLHWTAYIGAFTALYAAVVACVQSDIKRVLAFSTISQIGFMIVALGVCTSPDPHTGGLGYMASMFHLFTHAMFKALLLIGILGIYFGAGATTMNILEIAQLHNIPLAQQYIWFPLVFVGFGVLGALFPFHTWSPDGHASAPTAVSMLHAGVLMKLGGYGCFRVAMYLMPEAAHELSWIFIVLTTISVVYGAFAACVQTDLKYINAYSSVSHCGLVLFAILMMNTTAGTGAVLQMLSHGLMTALFFALIGMIYGRTHTRDVRELSGLMKVMPFLAVGYVIAGLANLGLPGLSGFVAEMTIFNGAFMDNDTFHRVVTIIACTSIVITAVYILRVVGKILYGTCTNEAHLRLSDATWDERLSVVCLVVAIAGMGLAPLWVSDMIRGSVSEIITHLMN